MSMYDDLTVTDAEDEAWAEWMGLKAQREAEHDWTELRYIKKAEPKVKHWTETVHELYAGRGDDTVTFPVVSQLPKVDPLPESAIALAQECDRIKALLVEKNLCYGNSALDPVRIFSQADATEQLRVRIDDKISRLQRGREYADEDTISDLIGYLILLKVAMKKADK